MIRKATVCFDLCEEHHGFLIAVSKLGKTSLVFVQPPRGQSKQYILL